MKMTREAFDYIIDNKIDYLVIKSTLDVEYTGCECSGGATAFIGPVIETGKGVFKDADYYIRENIYGIDIYIGKSFVDKLKKDSEIVLKHHLFEKKLDLIDYEIDNINKI